MKGLYATNCMHVSLNSNEGMEKDIDSTIFSYDKKWIANLKLGVTSLDGVDRRAYLTVPNTW